MVKIGTKYPLILLPIFDQIYGIVNNLNSQPDLLSSLERVTLQVMHLKFYANKEQFNKY